jgi:opacity protein-like surface antigen
MIRTSLIATIFGLLALVPLAHAQRNEFSVLAGVTLSTSDVKVGPISAASSSSTVAVEVGYAYKLKETSYGHFVIEVPVTWFNRGSAVVEPGRIAASGGQYVFFTPGGRFEFGHGSRLVPYLAAGFGAASVEAGRVELDNVIRISAITGVKPAFDFAGGLEFRLSRHIGLRGEVRDFVVAGSGVDARNHPVFAAGLAFHF